MTCTRTLYSTVYGGKELAWIMSDIRPVNYLMGKDGRVLRGGPFAPSERVRAVPPPTPSPRPGSRDPTLEQGRRVLALVCCTLYVCCSGALVVFFIHKSRDNSGIFWPVKISPNQVIRECGQSWLVGPKLAIQIFFLYSWLIRLKIWRQKFWTF